MNIKISNGGTMRHIFWVFFIFLFMASMAHAKAISYDTLTTDAVLSSPSGAYVGDYMSIVSAQSATVIKLRDAISARDSGNPTYGSGVNCVGWKKAKVWVDLGGTTPGVVIRPIFGNPITSTYYNGSERTLSSDEAYYVDVEGNDDFYVMIPEMTGTSPTCSIYIQKIN